MKQIIVITGAKGIGKTTAAVTCVPPSKIKKLLYVGTEDSDSDMTHLPFERIRMYDRLTATDDMLELLAAGKPPWVDKTHKVAWVEYYEYFVKALDKKLKTGEFEYLIIDTVGPVEMAMTAAVEGNRQQFGWSGTTTYGKREVEGVRPLYDNLLEAISKRGVKTIILTTHLNSVWVDHKPVLDKVKMGGRIKLLSTISSMMFWLVAGNNPHKIPAALVLKARMGIIKPGDDDFWDTRGVLPERIPAFSWREVARYKEQPADFANPAPGESMSEGERMMISELLSDKSMELMVLDRQLDLQQKKSGVISVGTTPGPVVFSPEDKARGMIAGGKSRAEVMKATGLPVGRIIQLEGETK